MLIVSILFFALAALLGLYLLSFVLRDKDTPKGIAFIHGPVAAIGLIILLIYAALYHQAPIVSIVLFIMAVFGGLLLIYKDLTGQPVPKWLALGHGLIATTGFIFLIVFTFF